MEHFEGDSQLQLRSEGLNRSRLLNVSGDIGLQIQGHISRGKTCRRGDWRQLGTGQGDRAVTWAGNLGHEGLEEPAAEGGLDDDQKGTRSGINQECGRQNRWSSRR
jgi:hypothetical protein